MIVDRATPEATDQQTSLDVTVFVCPVCLTVGAKDTRCPHYESGSVGWVYYERLPATLAVKPDGWTPVLGSLGSKVASHDR